MKLPSYQLLWLGVLVMLCGMCYGSSAHSEEEPPSNITVDHSSLKAQTGFTIVVHCTLNKDFKLPLVWLNPNGTSLEDLNDTRITHDGNGTMTITEARVSDSGQYTCKASDELHTTTDIIVYVMPSYFMEGLVILGINGVLLLIFLGCLAHSQIQQRKSLKGQRYTEVNKQPKM